MSIAAAEPEPIDQIPDPKPTAYTRIAAHREGTRQPILVDWLTDAEERSQILRWATGYAGHITVFHLLRLPIYQAKIAAHSPVGLYRVVRWLVNALTDAESRPLRTGAVLREDSREYLQLRKARDATVKRRTLIVLILGVPLLVGAILLALWLNGRGPWPWVALLGLIDLLGLIGRPRSKPLISRATAPAHLAPVLREGHVETALRSIGIPKLEKAPTIEFTDPIIKDGPGWLARVALPLGVTPEDVMAKRPALASGLRRPLGCVWPESGANVHGGLLKLFVSFQDLATTSKPYPLSGAVDLFQGLPYGVDTRGRKVVVPMIEQNILIGAMPGAGKTSVMRCLAIGAALDPTAEIHIWELYGKGDLGALEQVAHRYGSGLSNEVFAACVADLREIRADIERRAAALKKLTKECREMVPDAKTTREVANHRALGLFPKVVFLDEVQNLYTHEEYRKEATSLVLDIIRMGRAVGVILVQATQRPDKDSLPKAISANAGVRICLRVTGWQENDMVLGNGWNNKGVTGVDFRRADQGCAWLIGVRDDPTVAKAYYLDMAQAERLAQRARKLREAAHLITGHAAGEAAPEAPTYSLLADVRRVVVQSGRDWMWSEDVVDQLAQLRPNIYTGWTQEILAKQLGPLGVETKQINRTGDDGVRRNLRGVELADVEAAQRRRNGLHVVANS
jgi:S-DNA-T family DNA segregation ATPase FtsK/SpoIIIE